MKIKIKFNHLNQNIKKSVLLILLVAKTYASISQISKKDSITCLPNSQLRTAIKKLEECEIVKQENIYLRIGSNLLKQRIVYKDSIVLFYEKKDSVESVIKKNYQLSILNLNQQIKNHEKIDSIYKKLVKKQKIVNTIGGVLAGFCLGVVTIILAK